MRVAGLLGLRRSASDPRVASLLRHLPHLTRLNAGSLRLIDPAVSELVTFHLLEEVGHRRSEDRRARTFFLLRDTVEMARLQGRRVGRCGSVHRLISLHETLIDDARLAVEDGTPFSPPPRPSDRFVTDDGPVEISPLDSPAKLAAEARAMGHCCFAYRARILAGRSYLYHVRTATEQATLELVPSPCGWQVAQLAGRGNRPVTRALRAAVARWLRGNGPGALEYDEVPF